MIETKDVKIAIRDNITAEILCKDDVNWYLYNVLQPYFYEYLERKPTKKTKSKVIKASLDALVKNYKLNNILSTEIRFVIKVNRQNVGGITINYLKESKRSVELSYWIAPNYQRLGICSNTLKVIMSTIIEKDNSVTKFILNVLENNNASVQLANKLGFKAVAIEDSLVDGVRKIRFEKSINN